jgi:hypothetical protein
MGSDQNVFIRANNDFSHWDLPLSLFVDNGLPGWAIALIVIGSVGISLGIGYFIYIKYIKNKTPNRESEVERSLLEKEAE